MLTVSDLNNLIDFKDNLENKSKEELSNKMN